ncbi:hypothetical protein EGW08_004853 [Elysia chlorotica]|uniref:Uncharacterized protein n=1 Tax=Elysia chlorotica TaxID=188477 RepID=A0A3S0ZV06_ELYCH|nr:hypothetical protein EGW08_004853 [Elysia chlorotica]
MWTKVIHRMECGISMHLATLKLCNKGALSQCSGLDRSTAVGELAQLYVRRELHHSTIKRIFSNHNPSKTKFSNISEHLYMCLVFPTSPSTTDKNAFLILETIPKREIFLAKL